MSNKSIIDSPGLTRVIQQSGVELDLAWSPQGDRIAYYDYDSRSLYTVRTDSSGQSEVIQKEIFVGQLDWSPDGSRIAFSNGVGRVYILDLTTQQITPLSDDSMEGAEPSWSPDGTQIAFTLNPLSSGPNSSIAIINIDGSDLVQLTPDNNSRSPKWSPHNNQILFERDRNIYIMNLDGTSVRALIEDGKSYMPSWSPDGTRIAYISAVNQECGISIADGPRFCTNELRVMNADGSKVIVIRNRGNERYMSPVWAPRKSRQNLTCFFSCTRFRR